MNENTPHTSDNTPAQIIAYVPNARIGQFVDVDGTQYRVAEINLTQPHHPTLVDAATDDDQDGDDR